MLALAHNTAINNTTRFTPFEMMFGRECTMPIDLVFDLPNQFRGELSPVEWVNKVRENIEISNNVVRENIAEAQVRSKKIYDLRSYERRYDVGAFVFKLDSTVPKGISKKLTPIYTGPFVVEKEMHPLYTLRTKRGKVTTVHHDRLIAATPEYVPLVLKRQRAAIIRDALKSAKETVRMKKNLEYRNMTTLKADDIAKLPTDMQPSKETAAVKRPLKKVFQEYKAARERRKRKMNPETPGTETQDNQPIQEEIEQIPEQTPGTETQDNPVLQPVQEDEIAAEIESEEVTPCTDSYTTRAGRKVTRKVMFDL